MALSITQRLTILVALLGAAILIPAGIILRTSATRSIDATSKERAKANAVILRAVIMRQLDEDIMIDFRGAAIQYDKLTLPLDHWEIVRGNGYREAATGMFRNHPSDAHGIISNPKRLFEGKPYILATIPLIPENFITWESLPEAVKAVALAKAEGGMFLSAKTEVSGNHNVFAIKWLLPDRIVEVAVTDDGTLISLGPEDLPNALPAGTEIRSVLGQTVSEPKIIGWKAHDGGLIAIVEGQLPSGQSTRVAVNRLGEQHALGQGNVVSHVLPESRLWVVVAYDMSHDLAHAWVVDTIVLIGGGGVWLLMVFGAWQVTRHALRPVKDIVLRAERIKPPHLSERLPVGRAEDELSRITKTVNEMLDRIEAGYRRECQFTGDVSHELRHPLAKMRIELDLALSGLCREQNCLETLVRLGEYVDRMQCLTDSLLMLARLEGQLESVQMEPFDMTGLSTEVVGRLSQDFGRRIQLELGQSDEPLEVLGNKQMISVLLRNLLDNALRYSAPKSPVILRIQRERDAVRVEVEDQGPGIPEDQIAPAYDQFHRLGRSRSSHTGGMGLGLSIARAIADLHSTTVVFGPGANTGTVASFALAAVNHEKASKKATS